MRVDPEVVAVFENITTLAQLNQIFEMSSAVHQKKTNAARTTDHLTCDKMQTQRQRGRNQEMFVATKHMYHTFFFTQGKHPCQHVAHRK